MAETKEKTPSKPEEPQHPSSKDVVKQQKQEEKQQKEEQSNEVATRDDETAEQQEEAPIYSDFEFPDEDADLGNAWFPVRPLHNAMAFLITAPVTYGGTEYDDGYAVRTINNDGTIEDTMLSDEEFSATYVAVPPAKLD